MKKFSSNHISKVNTEIKNKPFWGIMSLFFFLSITVIIISSENSYNAAHITGNVAIQAISFAKGGSELTFEVRNVPDVYQVTAIITKEIKNGKIQFKEDPSLKFDGTALSKFIVSSTDEKKVSELRLMLKIKEDELKKARIKENEVSLFVNNKKLTTIINQKKDSYIYYIATSKEMGNYVIGKGKVTAPHSKPQVTTSIPLSSEEKTGITTEEAEQATDSKPSITEKQKPLVGQAVQLPSEEEKTKESVFYVIGQFFKGLFE